MPIMLAEAIKQLRNELRQATLDAEGEDIVLMPRSIELELAITFETEAKAGGGLKLLTFLDMSGGVKTSDGNRHKIKLTLDAVDKRGRSIKVSTNKGPANLR